MMIIIIIIMIIIIGMMINILIIMIITFMILSVFLSSIKIVVIGMTVAVDFFQVAEDGQSTKKGQKWAFTEHFWSTKDFFCFYLTLTVVFN